MAIAVGSPASASALRSGQAAAPVTTNPAALLADPKVAAVIIATPAPSHQGLAFETLAAGKDLFVEKPLCLSARSALELEREARGRGLILMTGHVFLYHPATIALKRLLDDGALGAIESVEASWLNTDAQPGDLSALWCLGPHPLSLVAWLLGTDGVTIDAAGDDDRMEIALAGERGWAGTVVVAWDSPRRERSLIVTGSEAVARFDGESGELSLADGDRRPEPVPYRQEPALTAELRAFVAAVRTRESPARESVTSTVVEWLESAAG